VIADNYAFVAFIPYAPEAPFETWIVPRRHEWTFLEAVGAELEALAEILTFTMGRFYLALSDPSYVLGIQTHLDLDVAEREAIHWRLVIKPKGLRHTGGLEDIHKVHVCRTPPHEAASWLRRRGNALRSAPGNILQADGDVALVKALRVLWRELGLPGRTAEEAWTLSGGNPLRRADETRRARRLGRRRSARRRAGRSHRPTLPVWARRPVLFREQRRVLELAHERYEEIRFRSPHVCRGELG
jgi:hypothetical protein